MGAILGVASVGIKIKQRKNCLWKNENVNFSNILFKLRIKSDFVFNS